MHEARRRMTLGFHLIAVLLLATSVTAEAQPARREWRVGWLSNGTPASDSDIRREFREQLGRLGYTEERNIHVEARDAEGSSDRLRALAAELVRLTVDVLIDARSGERADAGSEAARA